MKRNNKFISVLFITLLSLYSVLTAQTNRNLPPEQTTSTLQYPGAQISVKKRDARDYLAPEQTHEHPEFPHLLLAYGNTDDKFDGSFFTTRKDIEKPAGEVAQTVHGQKANIQFNQHLDEAIKVPVSNYRKELVKNAKDAKKTKRALACIGGGSKGLLEIISLTYLETIMNEKNNQDTYNKKHGRDEGTYIYISDLFDCGGGTSTGAIITAGLFYNKDGVRYKAFEVAQLYTRCLGVIFGEKNDGWFNSSLAQYKSTGLTNLLEIFFGNSQMNNAFADKEVDIFAVRQGSDTVKDSLLIFNQNPHHNISRARVVDALLSSAAAPSYFEEHNFVIEKEENDTSFNDDNKEFTATDGGTFKNDCSADLIDDHQATELYTFGAGHGIKDGIPEQLRGAGKIYRSFGALEAFYRGKDVSEQEAQRKSLQACHEVGKPLSFFAKINPKLVKGMELDSTSDWFVHQCVARAMRETETAVFSRIVTQLGFKMPTTENAADKTVLCRYGCLGLTTELRNKSLEQVYTLDLEKLSPSNTVSGTLQLTAAAQPNITGDSKTVDAVTESKAQQEAKKQQNDRNNLLIQYINEGITKYGCKFLEQVNFTLPESWGGTCPEKFSNSDVDFSDATKKAFDFYRTATKHIAEISQQENFQHLTANDFDILLKPNAKKNKTIMAFLAQYKTLVSKAAPTTSEQCELFGRLYFPTIINGFQKNEIKEIRKTLSEETDKFAKTMDEVVHSNSDTWWGTEACLKGLNRAFKKHIALITAPSKALPKNAGAPSTMASPKASSTSLDTNLASPTTPVAKLSEKENLKIERQAEIKALEEKLAKLKMEDAAE